MLSPAGVQLQPLEVRDFSGGMTDNYLQAQPNEFQLGENTYVNFDKRLITRPGLAVDDTSHARTPNLGRIGHILDSESQLFQISDGKIYYNNSGFTQVLGPTSNKALINGSTSTYYSAAKWNGHAFIAESGLSPVMRLFKDGSTWRAHELGLPALASTPTPTSVAGAKNFLYAFHHKVTYTSGSNTFEEIGPVTFVTSATTATNDPGTTPIAITAIPVLSNGSTHNYDTVNITVQIYRTQNNGTTYYRVGQVTNGTTSFSDGVSDTSLVNGTELYLTADGSLDHDQPPPAKHICQVNDILFLGAVQEGGVLYPNRMRISNRFKPWSCPSTFYEDFDEPIKGMAYCGLYPIVFCENKVYRIEGYYLPDGSGSVKKRLISTNAGCLSERSVTHVEVDNGLMWCGNDGVYYTDGNLVTRVSKKIPDTYKALTSTTNQKERIYGTYDPTRQLVIWATQADDVGSENDSALICHLRFGMSEYMPFTTWSGGSLHALNYAPSCIYYYNQELYHADTNGYLLRYDDANLSDIEVDTNTSASAWIQIPIIYDYKGPAFDFGTGWERKWVPLITVNADNVSSVSMLISVMNDNSGTFTDLMEFKASGNLEWGDPSLVWGDSNLRWNYAPLITGKRRMPKGKLRCTTLQVRLTNSFTQVITSTEMEAATFDGTANTATLPTLSWPYNVEGYYITTAADGYANEFEITSKSGSIANLKDDDNVLPTGSYAWKIYGYRKNEILRILSYVVTFAITSRSQPGYVPEV